MAEDAFAFEGLLHLGAGGGEFLALGDEGEHDRERPAVGGADERLKLHPHDAGLVEPDAHRPPAEGRVGLVGGCHVGQHLVGADVERAEGDALALGGVHHAGVELAEFGALGHVVADEELQLGPEEAHALGAGAVEAGQVGHETGVHQERNARAADGLGGLVADRGVAFLGLGGHRHLVAEGVHDGFVGPQVGDALVAVDEDQVAVQRLGGDALGMDDERDGERPGDDGGVAADGAFLEHDPLEPAAVVEQFGGADIAGDQDRVGRHFGAGFVALPGEDTQEAVRQVVEVVEPVAEVGVGDLGHAGAGGGLFLFDSRLGREAAGDVFLHPAHPALGIGEHAVGFEDLELFAVAGLGVREHPVDADAEFVDGGGELFHLAMRVVGDGIGDDDAGVVQPDMALGRAFLAGGAVEENGLLVARLHGGAFADEGAEFGHLGDHHGHDLDGVDLLLGEDAGLFRLHDQHAEGFAESLDGDAQHGAISLFPGFRHVAEAAGARRVIGVDDVAALGDAADEAFAEAHAGLVDGLGLEALGGAELERVLVAEEVDRADLAMHLFGDQPRDAVKARLAGRVLGHHRAQAAEHLPAVGLMFLRCSHALCGTCPSGGPILSSRRRNVRPPFPIRRHHAGLGPRVPYISGRSARKS